MKRRFILYRRKRGGMFYLEDTQSKKQESLHTKNRADAVSVLNARNESTRQPQLNLQIAKAYLSGTDSSVTTRTWQTAIESLTNSKSGANQHRWRIAARDKAFAPLLPRVIIETPGELLLTVMQTGTVSTNVYLRRLHNFCVDMNWLPWPLVPKRQWPAVKFKEKRAITLEEHQKIIAAEGNPERKALYQLCWHLGASQGDIANLKGEDVDWQNGTVSFTRKSQRHPATESMHSVVIARARRESVIGRQRLARIRHAHRESDCSGIARCGVSESIFGRHCNVARRTRRGTGRESRHRQLARRPWRDAKRWAGGRGHGSCCHRRSRRQHLVGTNEINIQSLAGEICHARHRIHRSRAAQGARSCR